MAKFRKKPVVIEAWHYVGHGPTPDWVMNDLRVHHYSGGYLLIDTLEGQMRANLGDWIIKGVKNELYPCKPDIFAATYEPVP